MRGDEASLESDSLALAETRMGLRLGMGSSLCPVGGRRNQKSTFRRCGKSAGAGHWAGGGTRRVHEESLRAGGDWNGRGGTTRTRKSAAQPQCARPGTHNATLHSLVKHAKPAQATSAHPPFRTNLRLVPFIAESALILGRFAR